MKKSKLLVLAVALIACMTLTFLVACDEETPVVTVCEHTYGDYSLTSQPTATATGTAIRVCSKCQVAETIEVAALTDTSVWTAVTTDATHSAPGKIEYSSDAFGKVTIAVDRLAACVYDKEVVDERYLKHAATCTDSAEYYKTCSCGSVGTETFVYGNALGHTEVIDEAHPSTCTVQGVTEGKHCSVCGETLVSQTKLPFKSHIPGPEETCEDDQVCMFCGWVIDAAHHIWSEDYKLVYDTVGGSFEEEGEAQASQYHAKYCTVCGEYDTTSKVEHNFGDEYLVGKKDFNGTDITRWKDCTECEYSEQVGGSLGYLEHGAWTLSEEQAADYNNPGYQVYTKEAYRYEMVIPKLVAPYDGKTYHVAGLSVGDTTNRVVNANPYTGVSVTLDENGTGEGTSYPLRGNVRVEMVEPAEGKVLVHVGNNAYNGYVDMEIGLIVYATDDSYSNVFILSPIGDIAADDIKASAWSYDDGAGYAMAITLTAECNLHAAHVLNIYVDNGIYADVTFSSSTEIEGDACYNADYLLVEDINGEPIKTFVYDGGMFVADGAQGAYIVDLGEGDREIVLNGHGKFVIASDNIQGVYTIVENAAYDADVYVVVDGNRVAYYQATIAGERINLVKPVANATFANVGAHSDDVISDAELNLNVANALPSVSSKDQFIFAGWCLDSACEGEIYTTYTPVDGTALTFYAWWAEPVNVHIVDAVAGNSDIAADPDVAYKTVLPAYVAGETFNGFYVFAGWYADETFATPFDVEDTTSGTDVYVYAKYTQSGVWNITTGSTYTFAYNAETDTWVSNNKGVNSSTATMEITAVDGPIEVSFTYWASSEAADKWDYLTIWYDDSKDGTAMKSVTAGGKTTTIADAKEISIVLRAAGEQVRFSYVKDNGDAGGNDEAYIIGLKINGMTITHTKTPDLMEGTYTCEGKSDLVLDGFGSFTMGEESGSYVKAAADADYSAIAYTAEKTYKIVITGTTYTATEYTVSASYNFGEVTTSLENTTAYYGKEFTLPDAPVVAGYVFRGWFTTSTFDGSAITVATITEDTVFYAKYDVAVTLTYKYLDGVTADAVENKFKNDVIETVKAMDVTVEGKVFIGWFMLDGSESGEWGDQFIDGAVITENTVVYAKWVVPHVTAGAYHGCNYDPDESKIVGAAKSNSAVSGIQLTISPEGYVTTTYTSYNGAKVNYNEDGSFTLTKEGTTYNGYYDASGVLVIDYASNKTEPYHDVYIFTKDELNVKSAYCVSWGKAITKLVRYTMTDDTTMNILYYNGKVYANVTLVAKNAEGGDITDMTTLAANVKSIEITAGANVFLFVKSGKDLYLADGTEGTYTAGSETIVLDGVGGITYNGNTGTYTAAAEDAGYGYDVVIGSATYTLTIDVSAKTYTMAENKVTVTYVNEKVTVASESVYRNVEITLYNGADLTVSGFIFRGWFATDTFDGNAITTTTLTDNAIFYAKYDAAVTLTFDYNGQGTEAVVVPDKYVGDKVSGIPAVGSDVVTSDGKVFAGWYTQNGTDGEWGEEVTTAMVLTGDATFYAKWIKAVESYGTYKGFNMYGSKGETKTKTSDYTSVAKMTVITIAANGSFGTGTLTDEQGAVTDGSMVLDGAYYYFNKELGIMWKKDGSSKLATGVGTDTDLGFREDVTSVAYSCWNAVTNSTSLVALITINYANGSIKNAFFYNDMVVANVSWNDGKAANELYSASASAEIIVKDKLGNIITKLVNKKTLVANDGKAGSYTGEYGTLVLDGFGTLTIGEDTVAYTLDGDVVSYVYNNAMRKVTLAGDAYTKTADGYAGTYTLPDGSTTVTLDGFGGAGEGATYVVSGNNVTVYTADGSTQYGIDVESKVFLGKSKFAGLTFTGNYYDGWGDSNSLKIVFNDSSDISGVVYSGYGTSYYFNFTAVLEGNVLTFTFGTCIDSGAQGKTMTATISGETMTITSCGISNNSYTFANNGSVSCSGFSL